MGGSVSRGRLSLVLAALLAVALGGCAGVGLFGPRVTTETVAGDYIAIYFTAPRYPDDPATHTGGIEDDLVALIDSAQESVDVAAYDLDLDSVADALLRARGDGVEVRLVTDGSNADEEAVVRLRGGGIPIVARPEGWGIMHDKFVVVDGMWTWTGSWNLTENGTYRNNNNAVLVASRALAEDYAAEFEEMFSGLFGPSSPAETPHPVISIQGEQVTAQVEVYFAPEDGVAEHIVQGAGGGRSALRRKAVQPVQPAAGRWGGGPDRRQPLHYASQGLRRGRSGRDSGLI